LCGICAHFCNFLDHAAGRPPNKSLVACIAKAKGLIAIAVGSARISRQGAGRQAGNWWGGASSPDLSQFAPQKELGFDSAATDADVLS
jgi:hypothetical protein